MYDLKKMAAEFKPGDNVYVLRKAKHKEWGWSNIWNKEMDHMVGQVGVVKGVSCDSIHIKNFFYPPFVLEKVTCGNPFKGGDIIEYKDRYCKQQQAEVDLTDDLFVYLKHIRVRHQECTLIKQKEKVWKLGCQTFKWEGDLFTSGDFNITRNQLNAIYTQMNSAFIPLAWKVGGYELLFMDSHFRCEGRDLGTYDTLKEILEYKEN